ncbi:MAG: hypothetical protein AAGC79_11235 [Pseudomonadota bacterium]
MARRYAVLRVPTSGPKAVIAEPWDFASSVEAEARISEIEADHLVVHHTYLEVFEYEAPTLAALHAAGVLI